MPDGFTTELLEALKECKNVTRGRLSDFAKEHNLQYLAGQTPRSLTADIALPCATQNELDLADAKLLIQNGVQLVAEGANMPTTLEATEYFISR